MNGGSYIKRANPEHLQDIFCKYASQEHNGEKFMTPDDFIRGYLGLYSVQDYNSESIKLLARIVNTGKDGLISYTDFQAFEGLLCFPDALYKTAFQLFDRDGNGMISYDEFAEVIKKTSLHEKLPFNIDGSFVRLYFGKNKTRQINYAEFTQFLHDFYEQYVIEAFKKIDKDGLGYISVSNFHNIMISIKSHLLTDELRTHLVEAAGGIQSGRRVSYPYFVAFNSLLNNMETMKRVYLHATNGRKTKPVSKDEFMHSAQNIPQITPLEIDILYQICDVLRQTGRLVFSDFNAMTPEPFIKKTTNKLAEFHLVSAPEDRGFGMQLLESLYRFFLGSIAGAVGATAVYPIDLVKTRMQNQRIHPTTGARIYNHSIHCFKKTVTNEGIFGLYSGLVPQLVGVAPEKAIKLTVNDLVRDKLMDENKKLKVWQDFFAGGCAGASQVIFTNPLEIVKIRLQVAGEMNTKLKALKVCKELGLTGLYQGARACMMRDICFNSIYFGAYSSSKRRLADENGYNNPLTLFLAGMMAGVPAAGLVTPADVIKTRLQVAAREGETVYNGIVDAIMKIWREEGGGAFWKGAIARVIRSSPQFGVTLLTYELLQRFFYIDFGGNRPVGSQTKKVSTETSIPNPDHIGGYQMANPIFTGIETKFGLSLPKYSVTKNSELRVKVL